MRDSVAVAKALYGAGFRRGDSLAIVSENRIEFPAITIGTILLNGIVAPLNVTYTEREF